MNEKALPKSRFPEKIMLGLGDVGANLCWTFMSMYITMYYTDSVGISAAVAGTMMLVARLLDGITDFIGAWIIEKVHFKMGKIRPWFMISAPLLGIGLFLCFHVPTSLSSSGKVAYVYITYTYTAAVAFTIYNLAFSSILNLMSFDPDDREVTAVTGRIVSTIGLSVVTYVSPLLIAFWGGARAQGAWSKISTLYAILCCIIVFMMGVIIKEKEIPGTELNNTDVTAVKKEKNSELFKVVLSEKYTWLLLALFISFYLYFGTQGIRVYFFRDVIGDFNLYSTASLIGSVAGFPIYFIVPFCFKKFGQKKTVLTGVLLLIASNVAICIAPTKLMLVYISLGLMTIGITPLVSCIFIYVSDLIDYIYAKHGMRTEGFVAMTSSIGTKIGTGIGSAFIGWGLAAIGYNAGLSVQNTSTVRGIVFITAGLPAILGVVMFILVLCWNLEKKTEQIN